MFLAPVQHLAYHQDLPLSLAEAWEFFSTPANLQRITPADLAFEVVSPLPERMYAGMIVIYRVRPLLGIAIPWMTEITHVREPEFFVDEQRSGPYRFWHHQHLFAPLERGVRMTDQVYYQLRGGLAGHCLVGGMVRRRLEAIFAYRRKVLLEMFGAIG
jgi:ligand-binding SRPBCC domain-containing protein